MRRKRLVEGVALAALAGLLCCGFAVQSTSPSVEGDRFIGGTRAALDEATTGDAFSSTPTPTPTPTPTARALKDYPFGPRSEWRRDIRSWARDSNSKAYVQSLLGSIDDRYGGIAAFNTDAWATPYYLASKETRLTTVRFSNCHGFDSVPRGLFGFSGQFEQVPIPSHARPATEADSTMAVYSPERDALWEFWKMMKVRGRWTACWGGRIDDVSKSPGYFDGGFGASGTGLSYAGGMIRISEVEQGVIPHAIAVAIPNASARRFVYPAQRGDGWDTTPGAVPEGTRFRLRSDVDLDRLHLSPIARLVAVAAKKYGFVVTDTAGAVAISGQGQKVGKGDAWASILGKRKGYNVLRDFPWGELEVVEPKRMRT